MSPEIMVIAPRPLARLGMATFPTLIAAAGEKACRRFLGFFTTNIRNRNTDMAYARAVIRFLEWCHAQGWRLEDIEPTAVAAYIEHLQGYASAATVKQHLAVIRQLFAWLVSGQVLPMNPASTVRGPGYAVQRGKPPV